MQKYNIADKTDEIGLILKNLMKDGDKTMRYLQSRLRGGREIYETGYHVCEMLQERDFNVFSDNRRVFTKCCEDGKFSDSKPFKTVEECNLYRFMGKLGREVRYQRSVSVDIPTDVKKHSSYLDTAVRKFIRSLFVNEYNLHYKGVFNNYHNLLKFVYVIVTGNGLINGTRMKDTLISKDTFTLSVNNISTLKRRHLKHGPLKAYREDVKRFVDNIINSKTYPEFDSDGFLNRYMKNDKLVDSTDSTDVETDETTLRKTVLNIQIIPDLNALNAPSEISDVSRKRSKTSKFYKGLDKGVDI